MFLIAKIVTLNTIFFFPGHCLFYAVIMYVLDTLFQSLRQEVSFPVTTDNGASITEGVFTQSYSAG
jgi:hypothetical protein